MSMRSVVVLVFLVMLVIAGNLIADHVWPPADVPRGVVGLVVDTSTSVRKDCPGMAGVVRDALAELPRGKGSHLFLVSLGSSQTRFEPQLELDVELPRRASGAIRGAADESTLQALLDKCKNLAAADGSAIFRAVRIGLAHVSTRCEGAAQCVARLFVATDLEENGSRLVRSWLEGTATAPPIEPLANDMPALQTVFCGYTSTSEAGQARSNDALTTRWAALFKRPESVEFQPFCSGQRGPRAGSEK